MDGAGGEGGRVGGGGGGGKGREGEGGREGGGREERGRREGRERGERSPRNQCLRRSHLKKNACRSTKQLSDLINFKKKKTINQRNKKERIYLPHLRGAIRHTSENAHNQNMIEKMVQ